MGAQGGNSTFGGTIQGGNSLTKSGTGLLDLAGTNTYSGLTTINAGTLRAVAAGALSPSSGVNVNGGALDATGFAQTVSSLTMQSPASLNLTIGNVLTATNFSNLGYSTLNLYGTPTGTDELISFPNGYTGQFLTVNLNNGGLPSGDSLSYASNEIDLLSSAAASASIWATAAPGSWNATGSWLNNTVPNADGAVAVINQPTSVPVTITLDAPQTVGTLQLGAGSLGSGYTLKDTGSNTLTFSNTSNNAAAQISVSDGNHVIDAPVVLASSLVITSNTSTPWTLSFGTASSITDNGAGLSLTLNASSGTLVLSGSDSYGGGTIVEAGTLIATNSNALPDGSSLTVGANAAFSFESAAAGR